MFKKTTSPSLIYMVYHPFSPYLMMTGIKDTHKEYIYQVKIINNTYVFMLIIRVIFIYLTFIGGQLILLIEVFSVQLMQ